MTGHPDGPRVAVVTGGGRGLGRAHALALAAHGDRVVVNDSGCALDGTPSGGSPAADVVDEIRAAGGEAVADTEDVTRWDGADRLVRTALDAYGRLDALVCSAGVLLDRPLTEMSEGEWDVLVATHLTGTAGPLRHAAAHWRARAERTGAPSGGRAVLTTSTAGIWGDAGRTNYSAAKAGVAVLGTTAARELAGFGATVNVLAPFARTRMTVSLEPALADRPEDGRFDAVDPANVSPLVVWLCSADAADVTGAVLEATGGNLAVIEAPRRGGRAERDRRWRPDEIGPAVRGILGLPDPRTPDLTDRGPRSWSRADHD